MSMRSDDSYTTESEDNNFQLKSVQLMRVLSKYSDYDVIIQN